jgi:hypothetical protein
MTAAASDAEETRYNGAKYELRYHSIDSADFGFGRCIAGMAPRTKLGLRPKRWCGHCVDHRNRSIASGPDLIRDK